MGSSTGILPNFVIAGAMKSGTSSLRMALDEHPQVFCTGEQHFFCEHFERGIDWYKEQFSLAGEASLVGEKCPDYLYSADAVERIARSLPDARIIVMLRDPVGRAYSHYWHERRRGRETLSFADALKEEAAGRRTGSGMEYVDMGRYVTQLEHLASLFPREAIDVVLFERFKGNPGESFAGVCRFLGVDDSVRPAALGMAHNAYRIQRLPRLFHALKRRQIFKRVPATAVLQKVLVRPGEYPPLEADHRARLTELFADPNAALGAWLGLARSPWDAPGATVREAP
jgi:sulfotransferase family protein